MNLKVQKRLASQILNCSPDRVAFDDDRLDDIKQAITNRDIKLLIGDGAIVKKAGNFTSKSRVRKLKIQKSKGRQHGAGSRKGKATARFQPKSTWMNSVRVQREFLRELLLKNIITRGAFRELYLKSKGGYFRSRRHIKLFLQEHDEMLGSKSVHSKPEEKQSADKTESRPKRARTTGKSAGDSQ